MMVGTPWQTGFRWWGPLGALVVVLVAFGWTAKAARRPARGGSLRWPTDSPVSSLDPLAVQWPTESLVSSLVYDAPFRLVGQGLPQPVLIRLNNPDDRGGRRRFMVRPQVVFHDGESVTARHLVSSLRRLMTHRDYGWLLAMVEGHDEPRSSRGRGNIRLIDRQNLEIRLRSPQSYSLLCWALATPHAAVVPSAAKAAQGVGTGPFVVRRRRGEEVHFGRNRDYFAGPPYLDQITLLGAAERDDHIRRFQLGRADASLVGDSVYGERSPVRGGHLSSGPRTGTAYLLFNGQQGPTKDRNIRETINQAIDRRRWASKGLEPAHLPGGGPQRSGRTRRSPAQRRTPLVLLVHRDDVTGRQLAPLIQRDLTNWGQAVQIAVVNQATERRRLRTGTWDLRLVTVSPISPQPVLQLGQLLALSGLQSEAFELLRRWPAEGEAALARGRQVLENNLPLVPLAHRRPQIHHRQELRGLAFDRLGRLALADLWLHRGAANR